MCSINGINWNDRELVDRMNRVTRHRGPDGEGVEILPGVTLGQDRLAIIDLSSAAAQPMWNADRTFCVVFNGEIYNYRQLREGLKDSWEFRTKSDTEVLLATYQKWGVDGLNRLNGIFAFAIWDVKAEELVLARDPFGVKPLYYSWDGKRLAFSSEIKAVLEATGTPTLDRGALSFFLSLSYVPAPRTMFRGISKLVPGTFAKLKSGRLSFGEIPPPPVVTVGSKEEARHLIRETAESAVASQLVSDRPVGVFLSGGLDSTVLAHYAAAHGTGSLKTFTSRFDVGDLSHRYNADADLAARTAARLGAEHVEITVSGRDLIEDLEKLIWHLEEPIGNGNIGALYRLSEAAKKSVVVVLGGDGIDELFGGYERYDASRLVSWSRLAPSALRRAVADAGVSFLKKSVTDKLRLDSDVGQYLSFWMADSEPLRRVTRPCVFDEREVASFFSDRFFTGRRDGDFESLMMKVDRSTWLTDESLNRTDKLSAAWGLEGRVPFLDPRLVALADAIPARWKLKSPFSRMAQYKRIWAETFSDLLSDEVRSMPKRGWYAPIAKWLRDPAVASAVRERIGALPDSLIDRAAALKMLDDHLAVRGNFSQPLWALTVLQAWSRRFNIDLT